MITKVPALPHIISSICFALGERRFWEEEKNDNILQEALMGADISSVVLMFCPFFVM